jgi:hypothetical protein
MKEITQHWLNSAGDDLKIIVKIIDDSSLTHQVAFHAQQAIEKSFKAVDSRYPGDLGLLPDGKPTINEAKIFYDFARDINVAINKMLTE